MAEAARRASTAAGPVAAIAFAAAALGAPEAARGQSPAAPVVTAAATVSSRAAALSRAFDADATTAWCPDPKDARGELELTFARPVRVKQVRFLVSKGERPGAGAPYRPVSVDVRLDQTSSTLDPFENGRNLLDVEALAGKEGKTLAIRLRKEGDRGGPAPGPNGAGGDEPDQRTRGPAERCLAEVQVELDGGTLLIGVGDEAARELAGAIAALTNAFRACDKGALDRLARFPVSNRELEAGFADAELYAAAKSKARPYPSARELGRHCNQLVFPAEPGGTEPYPLRPLGAGQVRVVGAGGVATYWDLTWRQDLPKDSKDAKDTKGTKDAKDVRGRWVLTRIAWIDFE